VARSAVATLLLLTLETALGVPNTRNAVYDSSRVGRMLRGPSDVSIVGADRSVNREIAVGRHSSPAAHTQGAGGFGNLPLFSNCFMTDDCAPGLFAVSTRSSAKYPACKACVRARRCIHHRFCISHAALHHTYHVPCAFRRDSKHMCVFHSFRVYLSPHRVCRVYQKIVRTVEKSLSTVSISAKQVLELVRVPVFRWRFTQTHCSSTTVTYNGETFLPSQSTGNRPKDTVRYDAVLR